MLLDKFRSSSCTFSKEARARCWSLLSRINTVENIAAINTAAKNIFMYVSDNASASFGITGTGYELPNFPTRSRLQTFSTGAALPRAATHQAVFPHGSMNFRSFAAVDGALIARRRTGVSRRPMRAPPAAVEDHVCRA